MLSSKVSGECGDDAEATQTNNTNQNEQKKAHNTINLKADGLQQQKIDGC